MSQNPSAAKTTEYYHHAMSWFFTLRPKLILLIESQPGKDQFFYMQTGDMNEPLFSALMELIDFEPSMKVYGLEKLRDCGLFVFDHTYWKFETEPGDDRTFPGMIDLYKSMLGYLWGKQKPALVGMPGVLDRFEELMREDGSYEVNPGVRVPYPNDQNRAEFLSLACYALGDRAL